MIDILNYILQKYDVFLIIFIRMSGIFIISPLFSRRNIPNITKIGFTLIISILLIYSVNGENLITLNGLEIFIVLVKELILGFLIGFICYITLMSLYIAGQIVDMQIGFGMVNVFDPLNNSQVPIVGNFYYIIAILTFLTINGHHILIKQLVNSFNIVPLGQIGFSDSIFQQFIFIFSQIFVIGFKISAPILATIFLTNVLLAILARTMPQMNVFIVGMPLKILIGILTIVIMIPLYSVVFQHIFDFMFSSVVDFLKAVNKG
ncbi:flagellar biosynthetic protein FliR [Thermohalobacter berrensis]|uniref:Flagellar biosynthetic protein FliR n=1 Tax=Thermohalobacter berrensis TaxID=99594 RepID=A0A419TAE9_9FIRM|nr:flagellar biosynthetic protein FliR [Thermohalobacter berrensis]RKD34450.1 flagellar biosynthetic protein FliR [Thermohalobacter berrensis]